MEINDLKVSNIIDGIHGTAKSDQLIHISEVLADAVDKSDLSADDKLCIYKCVYTVLNGQHYNEDLAKEQISKFWYTDKKGRKHSAPYWTEDKARELYETAQNEIPSSYNFYDFWVTLEMIKSDYENLLHEWLDTGDSTDIDESYYVKLAVNWLDDDDNPFGDSKIWGYFNSKEK